MQGTVSPDACPNLWIFWQGSWTAHSPVSVTHGLLTEGEKWFSRLEHSCLLPPLPLLSLSQTSNHSPLPDPVTAASVWVAIWLKLCSATEVGPLRCAHVVLIVVNNFFLLLLLLTGHTGGEREQLGWCLEVPYEGPRPVEWRPDTWEKIEISVWATGETSSWSHFWDSLFLFFYFPPISVRNSFLFSLELFYLYVGYSYFPAVLHLCMWMNIHTRSSIHHIFGVPTPSQAA